jgi:alcohol dehydrogenase
MRNFELYNPTKIVFGNGTISRIGEVTAKYGKKALLVSTRGSIKRLGLFDKVKKTLLNAGVDSIDLIGIEPNPKLESVINGATICKENKVDVIVALGGGSVIDCAKAIAFAALDDGDPWDFFIKKRSPKEDNSLPLIAALTLSATGSEMNFNSVITNQKTRQKLATHFDMSYPKVSIIDPELQITIPKFFTACGMVDTIAHVLESYFDGGENTPIQDRIAEGIVLTVIENESVLDDLENTANRANISWASTLALNGINTAGRENKPLYAHKIEHEIGGTYDIIHAAGLTPIMPAIFEILCKANPSKFKQFNERVFGADKNMDPLKSGLEGIEKLKQKFVKWEMPLKLSEAGVEKPGLDLIALNASKSIKDELFSKEVVTKILNDNF